MTHTFSGKRSRQVSKVWKPNDSSKRLASTAKHEDMILRKQKKAQQHYPRAPERDIAEVVAEEARAIEILLDLLQELGVSSAPAGPPVHVNLRWGNAPIQSILFLILIALGLVTGTVAEIRMRGPSGRLGAVPPPSNTGTPEPTAEQATGASETKRETASTEGAEDALQSLSEWLQLFVDTPAHHRVPREAFSVDGDATEPKARRRGDQHDRPLTHQNEYNAVDDPNHDRDHDPNYWTSHENATIYPAAKLSPFMRDLINSAGAAPVLLIPAIRKLGFDPHEQLTVHLSEFGNTNIQQTRRSTISPIEVIMHYTTTEKIADSFQPTGDRSVEFKNLVTDSRKYGIDNFFTTHVVKPLIFEFIKQGTKLIQEKLATFGIDWKDKASLFEVSGRGRKSATLAQHEDAFVRNADLGAILRVEKHGRARYFAIVPHHPDLVIEVPSITGDTWKGWMAQTGKSLLFKDPSELPSTLRYAANEKEATSLDSLDWVQNVVENILKPIVENSVSSLSSLVTNESSFASAAHSVAGLYIPYYDFGRAFINNDMKSAAIFLGLEFIPMVGSFGKKMFKTIYTGTRLPHTLKHMLNKLEATVSQTFNMGKDLHGLGFIKIKAPIKPARTVFKKGSRILVNRQRNGEETEN